MPQRIDKGHGGQRRLQAPPQPVRLPITPSAFPNSFDPEQKTETIGMKIFLSGACALGLTFSPLPAVAECAAEVAALFNGGALDPLVRPNRRETTVARQPDGTTTPISDVVWDGPINALNCFTGGCMIIVGAQSWTAPAPEGPWSAGTDPYSGVDPLTFVTATRDRLAASITKPECLGPTDLDGTPTIAYRFFSKLEPNEFGAWWGGTYSYWVDPLAGQAVLIELSEAISSWAPDPSADVQITTISYDDALRVVPPQ